VVPGHALDNPAVVAHARLVVIGGDSHRLHEEIITAGGVIQEGRFRRMNVGQTQNALEAGTDELVSLQTQERLIDIWPQVESSLLQSLEVRMGDRLNSMQRLLEERQDKEIQDITSILTELKQSIENELDDIAKPRQLEMFTENELDQLNQNIEVLHRRIQQIPQEIEEEIQAIKSRYANPKPRMFPVAVTFLVPERHN